MDESKPDDIRANFVCSINFWILYLHKLGSRRSAKYLTIITYKCASRACF